LSFITELKRRNVFRVGIAYAVTSWLLIQVADILFESIGAPPWVMQAMFVILLAGLVITIIFAWAFEMTPEGVKKEKDVDRSQSITSTTGRKLDRTIIVILVLSLGYFVADKFWLSATAPAPSVVDSAEIVEEKSAETVAVLPFVDMSQDGDNEYFSDGLTEEVLNILAKIKELRVAGRTSSFAFKNKNEDLRSIGEKLNVKSILEGSVRKDEKRNRVRITAQLVNVEDGYHLWSETYDRDLDDIFAIQEEIARKVAKALRVALFGEDEARIAALPVTDMSAYDLYLRGLQQINTHSFTSLKQAVETFGEAIERDPDYTPAKLKLSKAWLDLAFTGAISHAEAIENVQPFIHEVLEEDPANAEAHVLNARVLWAQKNRDARVQELRLALDNDPRNLQALLEMGRFNLFSDGNVKKGLEYIKEAERIDPYSVDVLWEYIVAYAFTNQPTKTEPYAARIGEIQPDNPNRYWGPGLAYQQSGQLDLSLDYQLKGMKVDPNDYEFPAGIAMIWMALGDLEQAERWAELADETGADQPTPIVARVALYLHREQYGLAGDLAKRALDKNMDNRRGSNGVLRRAYISDLVRQGQIQEAIDYFQDKFPGAFSTLLDLAAVPNGQSAELVDLAVLLQLRDPGSERASELINVAEQRLDLQDPLFLPWVQAIRRASIAAARDNKQAALEYLETAVELGLRFRWQSTLFTTIAFNSLYNEPEFKQLVSVIEEDMQRQRENAYQIPGALR